MTWWWDEAYWEGRPAQGYDADGPLPADIRQRSSPEEIRRAEDYHKNVWLKGGVAVACGRNVVFGSCCYHSLRLLFVHYVGESRGLWGHASATFGSCCYHSLQLLFVHYVGRSQGLGGRELAAVGYRSMDSDGCSFLVVKKQQLRARGALFRKWPPSSHPLRSPHRGRWWLQRGNLCLILTTNTRALFLRSC